LVRAFLQQLDSSDTIGCTQKQRGLVNEPTHGRSRAL
jgi:hypothetical protein